MFNKFELVGITVSVSAMALAIYLVQVDSIFFNSSEDSQVASVIETRQPVVTVASENYSESQFNESEDKLITDLNLKNMIIDDITLGAGEAVKAGDSVSVHYVGTFQDGKEFDSSKKRGETFVFKVGAGQVIKGWDEGLVGMQKGGERVLVIPPEMAYGQNQVGPIPGNSTLVFSIELVDIN